MGTSSTRSGRLDSNNNNASKYWQSFKTYATKYFNGKGLFSTAIEKCIKAYGGYEFFGHSKSIKKSVVISNFLETINNARQIGLRETAINLGIEIDDDLSNEDLLILIANSILDECNVSGEDSYIREEIISSTLYFSPLFDENGFIDETKVTFEETIIAMSKQDMINDIFDTFVEACPFSTENDKPEITKKKLEEVRSTIKKAVEDEFKKEIFEIDDYNNSFNKIKNNVLHDLEKGDK